MSNYKETIEKDMAAAKDLAVKAAHTTEDMLDTALEHVASVIMGEKVTKESEKAYAEEMAYKLANFGDAVYEAASERFGGKLEKAGEYFSNDVKTAVEAAKNSKN